MQEKEYTSSKYWIPILGELISNAKQATYGDPKERLLALQQHVRFNIMAAKYMILRFTNVLPTLKQLNKAESCNNPLKYYDTFIRSCAMLGGYIISRYLLDVVSPRLDY